MLTRPLEQKVSLWTDVIQRCWCHCKVVGGDKSENKSESKGSWEKRRVEDGQSDGRRREMKLHRPTNKQMKTGECVDGVVTSVPRTVTQAWQKSLQPGVSDSLQGALVEMLGWECACVAVDVECVAYQEGRLSFRSQGVCILHDNITQ